MNYPITRSELKTIGPAVHAFRISEYVDKCVTYMNNIILFKGFYDASGAMVMISNLANNVQKPMMARMIMQNYVSNYDISGSKPIPLGGYAINTGKYKIQFKFPMTNVFNTPEATPTIYNPLNKLIVFPSEMVEASPAIISKLQVMYPDTTFVLSDDKLKLDVDWS